MNGTARKDKWETWKDIPGFVLAILGIIVIVMGAAIGVVAHFATKSELAHIKCISEKNIDLLGSQIKSGNAYTNYVKAKAKKSDLEQKKAMGVDIDQKDIIEQELESKASWESIQDARKTGNEIVEFLKTGGCDK